MADVTPRKSLLYACSVIGTLFCLIYACSPFWTYGARKLRLKSDILFATAATSFIVLCLAAYQIGGVFLQLPGAAISDRLASQYSDFDFEGSFQLLLARSVVTAVANLLSWRRSLPVLAKHLLLVVCFAPAALGNKTLMHYVALLGLVEIVSVGEDVNWIMQVNDSIRVSFLKLATQLNLVVQCCLYLYVMIIIVIDISSSEWTAAAALLGDMDRLRIDLFLVVAVVLFALSGRALHKKLTEKPAEASKRAKEVKNSTGKAGKDDTGKSKNNSTAVRRKGKASK